MPRNDAPARPPFLDRWNDFWDHPRARRVACAAILVLLIAAGADSVRRAVCTAARSGDRHKRSSEFPSFYERSRVAVFDQEDVQYVFGHRRAYPPFFELAFIPFSWSGLLVSALIFAGFNALALLLCTDLCVRVFWRPGAAPRFGVCLLLLLVPGLMIVVTVALRMETDLIILLALCGGIHLLLRQNRPFWAGFAFSFAAAVKLIPAFLAFYLLWKREWKALIGMLVGLVFLLVVLSSAVYGFRGNIGRYKTWWQVVMAPCLGQGAPGLISKPFRETNQSLTAAAFRFLNGSPEWTGDRQPRVNLVSWSESTVRRIALAGRLALMVGLMVLWWPRRTGTSLIVRGAELSTALIAMLELSEVSGANHHAVLLVPFAVGLACLASWGPDARSRRATGWGLAVAAGLISLACVPILRQLSVLFFASITLLVVMIFLICQGRREARVAVPAKEVGAR